MDMLFALILLVIGMGVVYMFLYILVWVMRGLRFFERLPGFKEPRPVDGQNDPLEEGLTSGSLKEGLGEEGDDKEIVAAAVSAYMMLQNRDQGRPGPTAHPQNDLGKVTI